MSNKSIILNTNRPGLFTPKVRGSQSESLLANSSTVKKTLKSFVNTNLKSTSSFRYGDKVGMVSTQQVPIDYSKFENHTFFHSAVAKVNESFEKIINFYPYDGNNKQIEDYEDNLTGFEKYILDSFPKNVGYLIFSGTQKGEDPDNGFAAGLGTHISVVDSVGSEHTALSSLKTGKSLLNPDLSPFSFEFHVNVPKQANDNQVILQKKNSESVSKGFVVALSASSDASKCDIIFGVTSGSANLYVTSSLEKGKFNHIFAGYDKLGDQKLHMRVDVDNEVTSSKSFEFDSLIYPGTNFLIGTGSSMRLNDSPDLFIPRQTFSGSMDELRYYRSFRTLSDIKKYRYKNLEINNTDEESNLLLYYKFNEPYGSHAGNNLILDSSGNSFNTNVSSFHINNRLTGSDVPMLQEKTDRSPVLFPNFPSVIALNNNLMTTASLYDDFNPNLITKLVPNHYFEEANVTEDFNTVLGSFSNTNLPGGTAPGTKQLKSAQMLTVFLLIWAKFFDELKIFADAFGKLKNLSYDEYETIPDALLKKAGEIQGLNLPSLFKGANINQLFEGVDLNSDPVKSQKPLIEIQNLIWRRILASLPFIRLTKGTLNSVESVFRSAGIAPENIFLIREYGGSFERRIDKIKEKKKDVIHLLAFTGSNSLEAQTLDFQGRPNKKPHLKSGFLSGSRIEAGTPEIRRSKASATILAKSSTPSDYDSGAQTAFTLTSTDGTKRTYEFAVGGSKSTGDVVTGTTIRIQILGLSTKAAIAEQIKLAIMSSAGHNGKLIANRSSNSVVVTQATPGAAGNTIIPAITNGNASELTINGGIAQTSFAGAVGFVKTNNNFYHGISSTPSDGLFTSGSFTFEGQYKFDHKYKHDVTQSLVRLHVTGTSHSSQYESAVTNLLYNSGSKELTLFVVDSPNPGISPPFITHSLVLKDIDMFDSDLWNVSFGVSSGLENKNINSGTLYLRAGKAFGGKIEKQYVTSAFYRRVVDSGSPTSVFSNVSNLNTKGAFITVGSQSLGGASHNTFINASSVDKFYRTTNFTGELGAIRFWSKKNSIEEWQAHTRNPMSFGTNNPKTSYLFEDIVSGSFEKLRLQTSTKQGMTASDGGGGFRYFDFSHNNKHLTGSGFESKKRVVNSEHVIFNTISPNFDLSIADHKVRVRSLNEASRRLENPYALTTPIYEVFPGERTLDDPRFAIEMSSMKGLNDDIVRIFSDYEFLDKALGSTNLLFGDRYPDLLQLRKLYFENVLKELNLGKYRELFKWIDNSFTDLVGSMLPHTTKFMGINFVYENHMLERNRFRYYFDELYLKSKPIVSDRNLLLSQFIAIIKRM